MIRTFGPAWAKRVAGLHVVKLKGSSYEMGRQHGALLKDSIPHGPLAYYRTYVEAVLRRAGVGALAPLLRRGIYETVGRLVAARFPPFAHDAIRGLADGAGMPLRDAMEACVMPDTLLWIVSRALQISNSPRAAAHEAALARACSSAIAWGEATRDGKLLHARNFDYHGVACWPREAAVIFHEPESGQRYVSVAAAGILLGGITAMNQAGLTLTVHQHMFTGETSLGGTPIGAVGDIVMREARSLDEAQAILERHRPIGCWSYIIADGARREVLCWEENPRHRAGLRTGPGDTTFRYANTYQERPLAETERESYGSYWRWNRGRYARLGALLAERRGRLDPDAMAAILADCDPAGGCRMRRSIAMLMTVASVVFSPEDGVVWVATGGAPTSQNRFEAFDLAKEDHAPERGALTGGIVADRKAAAAFEAYRDAYVAYFDGQDVEEARLLLERACDLAPGEALFHAVAGLLAIAAGEPAAARAELDRAVALGHVDPERQAALHLWRGRALDLLGERNSARADYEAALAAERRDAPVERAAKRSLRRPFTAREARGIAVDFAMADVVAP